MAKYTVDFEFTPTLENAPDLLMDVAALLSTIQTANTTPPPVSEHTACIPRAEHEAAMSALQAVVTRVTAERDQLIANASALKAGTVGMPHIGELVKILPNPGNPTMYGGVVKRILGKGGAGGIEVLPKGHGHTIVLPRKYIKRYAVNERPFEDSGVVAA